MTPDPSLQAWGAGIFALDSGYVRPRLDAIHLLVQGDRAAIIDTGTTHACPRVLAALHALGIPREHVDWILLTHVHLDHAGGAGALLEALPEARLAVHPRGARHMIDPSRLWAGTVAVYGEAQAQAHYGRLVPIDPQRVVEVGEGANLTLAGRELQFLDTPGHARHHVVIRDTVTGHLFTGDTFGISYREFDREGRAFIFPTCSPVQFDAPALLHSLDRLLALKPEAVYLTHYSQVRDIPRLGAELRRLTIAYAEMAESALAETGASPALAARLRTGMTAIFRDALRLHGAAGDADELGLLALDIDLNSSGLIDWLQGLHPELDLTVARTA